MDEHWGDLPALTNEARRAFRAAGEHARSLGSDVGSDASRALRVLMTACADGKTRAVSFAGAPTRLAAVASVAAEALERAAWYAGLAQYDRDEPASEWWDRMNVIAARLGELAGVAKYEPEVSTDRMLSRYEGGHLDSLGDDYED